MEQTVRMSTEYSGGKVREPRLERRHEEGRLSGSGSDIHSTALMKASVMAGRGLVCAAPHHGYGSVRVYAMSVRGYT